MSQRRDKQRFRLLVGVLVECQAHRQARALGPEQRAQCIKHVSGSLGYVAGRACGGLTGSSRLFWELEVSAHFFGQRIGDSRKVFFECVSLLWFCLVATHFCIKFVMLPVSVWIGRRFLGHHVIEHRPDVGLIGFVARGQFGVCPVLLHWRCVFVDKHLLKIDVGHFDGRRVVYRRIFLGISRLKFGDQRAICAQWVALTNARAMAPCPATLFLAVDVWVSGQLHIVGVKDGGWGDRAAQFLADGFARIVVVEAPNLLWAVPPATGRLD